MPEHDDNTKRLYNVSITRARYRLFLIGNFNYYLSKAKNVELGRENGLIQYLLMKKFPRIDAKEIAPKLYQVASW